MFRTAKSCKDIDIGYTIVGRDIICIDKSIAIHDCKTSRLDLTRGPGVGRAQSMNYLSLLIETRVRVRAGNCHVESSPVYAR